MLGGLFGRGAFHGDPKCGSREVAGEFSVPDFEGLVFEIACGCFENAEEFHGRYR